MGEVIMHPAMKRTAAPLQKLRTYCDFRRVGYHYLRNDPLQVYLFRPPHRGFYDQWRYVPRAVAEALQDGGNVVAFRPRRPQLRVIYNHGDWQVVLFTPNGERIVVANDIPVWFWVRDRLLAIQESLLTSQDIWCEIPAVVWFWVSGR